MVNSHSYSVDAAIEIGVENAIMLEHIAYWYKKNKADDKNFYDNEYWTYNSIRAFKNIFPYWTEKQIRRILSNLENLNYIKTGNYNEKGYDRTKWYSLTDKAKALYQMGSSICLNEQKHLPKQANGFAQTGEPIPGINQYKPGKNKNIPYSPLLDSSGEERQRDIDFSKPFSEEEKTEMFDQLWDVAIKKHEKIPSKKAFFDLFKDSVKEGMKRPAVIKTKNDFERILQAWQSYSTFHRQKKTEHHFTKALAVWLNKSCWEDSYGNPNPQYPGNKDDPYYDERAAAEDRIWEERIKAEGLIYER